MDFTISKWKLYQASKLTGMAGIYRRPDFPFQ